MPLPKQLRYVVLRHDGIPDPHYDLMFETSAGSALATWRSDNWPLQTTSRLTPLPDHRSEYLTYEGPVSGNRGTVTRITTGHHEIIDDTTAHFATRLIEANQTLRLPRS